MTPSADLSGAQRTWHKITLDFEGPELTETADTFTDYRLNVTFRNADTGEEIEVPGYFAADGDAGNSGSSGGTVWRAHFNPPSEGTWTYEASFRTGNNVAVSLNDNAGQSAGHFDGATGSFEVAATDKTGDDLRAKGMLSYDGDQYLNFAGDGSVFLKSGVGSPENFLGFSGFDNTPDSHDYSPHLSDFNAGDPTWAGGKGEGIIGAVNYLAENDVNSAYMMLMNISGDGRDVSPWASDDVFDISKNAGNNNGSFNLTADARVFDVSKLDQWEIVFEHMQQKGITLHLFLQETENDFLLNDGELGLERQLFIREMVARFGHHNGIIWNLGEENTNTLNQLRDHSSYLKAVDAYDHPVALHTFPGNNNYSKYYEGLAGEGVIDVLSIQTGNQTQQFDFDRYLGAGENAGQPYVAFYDEPGNASNGLMAEGDNGWQQNHEDLREVLWDGYMEGGSGAEWYFGYQSANGRGGDLEMEDFALRESAYEWAASAREFFEALPLEEMVDSDGLTTGTNGSDQVLAKAGEVYAIYLHDGGSATLDLSGASGTFDVRWFDVIKGTYHEGTVASVSGGSAVSIGEAPSNRNGEWAVLVTAADGSSPPPPPADPDDDPTPVPTPDGAFLEENGLLVVEAESLPLANGWETRSTYNPGISGNIGSEGQAAGDDFIVWEGKQSFGGSTAGDNGLITFDIQIQNPGLYRFDWRMQVGNGTNTTEHNDSWLKIEADAFYGDQNNGRSFVVPRGTVNNDAPAGATPPEGQSGDGFFKVYGGTTGWSWSARTSDSDAHNIYARFDAPGTYQVQIAGRSSSHVIDRLILVNEEIYEGNPRDLSLPESARAGETPPPPPPPEDEPDQPDQPDTPPPDDTPTPPSGDVEFELSLIDIATGQTVEVIENGETIAHAAVEGKTLTLIATPVGTEVESVRFDAGSLGERVENVAPYVLFGDENGVYLDGTSLAAGQYSIKMEGFSADDAGGTKLGETVIDFTVADQPAPPPNRPPEARDVDYAAAEDSAAKTFAAGDFATDPDGDPVFIRSVSGATLGAIVVAANGTSLSYTPNANANGTEDVTVTIWDGSDPTTSVTSTLSIDLAAVNDAPVARDDTVTVTSGEAVSLAAQLLSNDRDVDSNTLSIGAVSAIGDGLELDLAANGALTLTAARGTGTATFRYTATDGQGVSTPATVTVTVQDAALPEPPEEPTPPSDPEETVVAAVNIGGPAYTGTDGTAWRADDFGEGRRTAPRSEIEIAGTEDDALYLTGTYGPRGLDYDMAMANGSYRVELHFAETWNGAKDPGKRVFDVAIEGEMVAEDVDIAGMYGYRTAYVMTTDVEVTDGLLNIDLIKGVQNPTISAIKVTALDGEAPADPPSDPPADPPSEGPLSQYLSFALADSRTDATLTDLTASGESVDLDDGARPIVFATALEGADEVESVALTINGKRQMENVEPYALFGDIEGDFRDNRFLSEGDHTITVEVFDEDLGRGTLLETVTFDLTLL